MSESVQPKIAGLTQVSHKAEEALHRMCASVMDPGNGKIIHLSGATPISVRGPTPAEVNASIMQGLALCLQNTRFALLMLVELEARIRALEGLDKKAPQDAPSAHETVPATDKAEMT